MSGGGVAPTIVGCQSSDGADTTLISFSSSYETCGFPSSSMCVYSVNSCKSRCETAVLYRVKRSCVYFSVAYSRN